MGSCLCKCGRQISSFRIPFLAWVRLAVWCALSHLQFAEAGDPSLRLAWLSLRFEIFVKPESLVVWGLRIVGFVEVATSREIIHRFYICFSVWEALIFCSSFAISLRRNHGAIFLASRARKFLRGEYRISIFPTYGSVGNYCELCS